MVNPTHNDFKHSIDVHTDDLAIVYCLRAISDKVQKSRNQRIAWGNTKNTDWRNNKNCVTFRFTEKEYRENFKKEALRMLNNNLFEFGSEKDNNPATKAEPSSISMSYKK